MKLSHKLILPYWHLMKEVCGFLNPFMLTKVFSVYVFMEGHCLLQFPFILPFSPPRKSWLEVTSWWKIILNHHRWPGSKITVVYKAQASQREITLNVSLNICHSNHEYNIIIYVYIPPLSHFPFPSLDCSVSSNILAFSLYHICFKNIHFIYLVNSQCFMFCYFKKLCY